MVHIMKCFYQNVYSPKRPDSTRDHGTFYSVQLLKRRSLKQLNPYQVGKFWALMSFAQKVTLLIEQSCAEFTGFGKICIDCWDRIQLPGGSDSQSLLP